MPDVVLYAGPSAFGAPPSLLASVRVHPPAERGSIDELIDGAGEPGVVILCDGVFQSRPAVSHAELCRALDGGWEVWGVSSLGAIRAHELRFEGMHGFGYVHSQFARFDDFRDDEMCLLHFPEAPYFPISEALVNVRYALDRQAGPLGIPPPAVDVLLASLSRLWFGDRTEERIRRIMIDEAGIDEAVADRLCLWLQRHRIKTIDLCELLAAAPWRQRAGAVEHER